MKLVIRSDGQIEPADPDKYYKIKDPEGLSLRIRLLISAKGGNPFLGTRDGKANCRWVPVKAFRRIAEELGTYKDWLLYGDSEFEIIGHVGD